MTDTVFDLMTGTVPVLLSIPHLGTILPEEIRPALSDEALSLSDTDWHLDRLYDFAQARSYSVLQARISRYAVDLNRPASGESLYPGQTTTGLFPTETFKGVPLYRPGREPDAAEQACRLDRYWRPYHVALQAELDRLLKQHGAVLLWEAHSIASVLPRLFEGRLPDLNLGTHSGAACADEVLQGALTGLAALPPNLGQASHVVNGRFKGGYITRHYGAPSRGIHAIQLEMVQCLYMEEAAPFNYRPDLAAKIRPVLQALMDGALDGLRTTLDRP